MLTSAKFVLKRKNITECLKFDQITFPETSLRKVEDQSMDKEYVTCVRFK